MTATERTLKKLRMALADGTYHPGSRMPPERDLAGALGVGRSTLRKALASLEDEGRVRRRVGHGTFAAEALPGRIEAPLTMDPPPSPADVMEARRMIEPAIVGAAALRATAPEIDRLRDLVEEGAAAGEWRAWERSDSAFHRTIASASRNSLLVGFLDVMNVIRRQEDWRRLRGASLTDRRQALYTSQHRAILSAIITRDAPAAVAAMHSHLDTVRRTMIADANGPIDGDG
ncbi:MAG: FadR/GntR family transcriptional regulator [Paracoccaceae bacterium]